MTTRSIDRTLTQEEIDKLSSVYLREGRKKESWEFIHASITDSTFEAKIRMTTLALSPTDTGGFHLPFLTALEFVSQMNIIYMNVWSGLSEKTRECWMIESSIKCHEVIRDPESINVLMRVDHIKQVKGHVMIDTYTTISDGHGLFEATMKGFMS